MKVVLLVLQTAAMYLCGLILLNMSIESRMHLPRELCVDTGKVTSEPETTEAHP